MPSPRPPVIFRRKLRLSTVREPGTRGLILQWNDPFLDSANDYDLLLLNNAETRILASSTQLQDGDDSPVEFLSVTNGTQTPAVIKVVIVKASGEERHLEMFLPGGPLQQVMVMQISGLAQPVIRAMLDTAVDLGPPGPDTIFGAGRIDAVSAAEKLPPVQSVSSSSVSGGFRCQVSEKSQ